MLLGLYGSTDGKRIMKLGFITLNTYATDSCDEAIPIVDEEDEVVVETKTSTSEKEDSLTSEIITTINGDVTFRFLALTIMALVIVFMLLCICTQCVKFCCPSKASVQPIEIEEEEVEKKRTQVFLNDNTTIAGTQWKKLKETARCSERLGRAQMSSGKLREAWGVGFRVEELEIQSCRS